jgi:hypothetical protein
LITILLQFSPSVAYALVRATCGKEATDCDDG